MNFRGNSVRVLIIDDCPIVRNFIKELLADKSGIEVIGEAANGEEGVQKALFLRPDVIIMDIEMPVMNGLEAIEIIMQENPTPILVVTSYGNARLAYEAVSRGALEVVEKPDIDSEHCFEFVHKIRLLAGVKVIRHIKGKSRQLGQQEFSLEKQLCRQSKAVAIASSLGGAKVLETILSQLTADFPVPIVVAQHISEGFAEALTDWLNQKTPLAVSVAKDGEPLAPGRVLIVPPEYNAQVDLYGNVKLLPCLPSDIYHPSCDKLLSSVAKIYREGTVGIILTGMGQDGVEGLQAIKTAGGITIAQNEQTSLIYNMPKVAIERGIVDFVLPAGDIAATLRKVAVL